MSNCCCNRETDPAGTWYYEDLLGAVVRIKSTSPGMRVEGDKLCTIEDIVFRVSLDGKTITKITLVEYPNYYFTWKDLEVIKIIERK